MSKYSSRGSYAGYDKNNKEREALDYYATPPEEVTNILQELNLPKNQCFNILEPSCGGGHMIEGILNYFDNANIYATDIKQRENKYINTHNEKSVTYQYGKDYDFLSENYPYNTADIVIMNPPFKVAVPFILHGLEIAKSKLIVLGRTKLVESINRYEKIFENTPPTGIYQYIDRIACAKNGIFENLSSIEAYSWFIWDKEKMNKPYETIFKWIWSKNKK